MKEALNGGISDPRNPIIMKMFSLIQDNPKITAKKTAESLGITEDGAFWHLDKMKKNNRISRVGATKNGHWEILKK